MEMLVAIVGTHTKGVSGKERHPVNDSPFCSHVDPTMPPIVVKTDKITVIHHVITIIIHPGHNHWPEMAVWAHGVHNFVPESQVMEHIYHVDHFRFVL